MVVDVLALRISLDPISRNISEAILFLCMKVTLVGCWDVRAIVFHCFDIKGVSSEVETGVVLVEIFVGQWLTGFSEAWDFVNLAMNWQFCLIINSILHMVAIEWAAEGA